MVDTTPRLWSCSLAEVMYPCGMFRGDFGGVILKIPGFTIMVGEDAYFLQFIDADWGSLENMRPWQAMVLATE